MRVGTSQLRSRIHMIFGHHTADQIPNIRKIAERIPRTGKKSLFIAELGGIHFREFEVFYNGSYAVENAEICVAAGEADQRLERDVAQFINTVTDKGLWRELKKRTAVSVTSRVGKGKRKKAKSKKKKTKPLRNEQLVHIGKKKFQLALLLMAKLAGYEVSTEMPSGKAVLNSWLSTGHEQDFSLYWANVEPLDFKFQVLVEVARTRYRFLQLHQLERDKSFSQRLMSEAEKFDPVVVQWGIGHMGYYQREMPGINIHTHSDLRFEEKVLSEGVSPGNLTETHLSYLLKDQIYRLLSSHCRISFYDSVQLVDRLPDDLTELERFFVKYNGEFRQLLNPQQVFKNIYRSLTG